MLFKYFDEVCGSFGVLYALLLRWGTSLHPYSGAGKPPMFGDYEAQRHWMEITVNLPVEEWYQNTTRNDLLYWGLDYPPLTAYHSWLCGLVASFLDGKWTALGESRGFESYHHKVFMRTTVIIADALIFFPAVVFFWNRFSSQAQMNARDIAVASTLMLIYPGLILIDHGHFQYNCISLGLALWGIALVGSDKYLLGAAAFTLSLHYKQMALYYSFPFFFYLFGTCLKQKGFKKLQLFLSLGFVVLAVSAVCWAPFLRTTEMSLQVVKRMFPVDRGLFEDKVANIWCSLSVVIKLKHLFSNSVLAYISAGATLIFCLPSCLDLLRQPSPRKFHLSLINCSLVFFLLSYQVHEKTILFAAVPFYLLNHDYPGLVLWFSTVSVFSMFPLLLKDGLLIPYISLTVLNFVCTLKANPELHFGRTRKQERYGFLLFMTSLVGCLGLNLSQVLFKPPQRYPDLFVLLNAVYSCIQFVAFCCYTHYLQFTSFPVQYTKIKKR